MTARIIPMPVSEDERNRRREDEFRMRSIGEIADEIVRKIEARRGKN